MKKPALILTVLVLTGVAAVPAQADFRHTSSWKANRLQHKVNEYRNTFGERSLYRGLDVELAAEAHNWATYKGAYWGSYLYTIAAPFQVWIRGFVTGPYKAMIRQVRCRNRYFTPALAASLAYSAKPGIVLSPLYNRIGLEWSTFRRTKGYWQGKGKCRMATMVFAG